MNPILVLIIPDDPAEAALYTITPTLEAFQDIVGGEIALGSGGAHGAAYVRAGGERAGLAPNELARAVADSCGWRSEWLFGPAVFFGIDSVGDEIDVPLRVVYAFHRVKAQRRDAPA